MELNPLSNDPNHWQSFVIKYWDIINQRPADVIERENWFQCLPAVCQSRNPPELTRQELSEIIVWKHTDPRWRNKAKQGLDNLSDKDISDITIIAFSEHIPLSYKIQKLLDVHGWGIATASAILTAGRPDLYGVIDKNVLKSLAKIEEWKALIKVDEKGDPIPSEQIYPDFVDWIRIKSLLLSKGSAKNWTPREVEMALWADGACIQKKEPRSESTTELRDDDENMKQIVGRIVSPDPNRLEVTMSKRKQHSLPLKHGDRLSVILLIGKEVLEAGVRINAQGIPWICPDLYNPNGEKIGLKDALQRNGFTKRQKVLLKITKIRESYTIQLEHFK